MIKHIWSLICKKSELEAQTNNLSITDVLENIQCEVNLPDADPEKQPIGMPINYELISLFYRDTLGKEETFSILVSVIDPNGKELGKFPNELTFKAHQNRVRNMMKFDLIGLTRSGTYAFDIFTIGEEKGSKPKKVTSVPLDIVFKLNGREY